MTRYRVIEDNGRFLIEKRFTHWRTVWLPIAVHHRSLASAQQHLARIQQGDDL